MKKYIWFVALAFGVAALGVWRSQPSTPNVAPQRATRGATTSGMRTPTNLHGSGTALVADTIASAPLSRDSTRPALQDVLPGLAAPVADWRSFAPARLAVRPIPGVEINFTAQRVTSDGRHTIWVGTCGTPGVTLVASGAKDRWDGIVTVPNALEYDIHISSTGVIVEKKDFAADICEPAGPASDRLAAEMMAPAATAPAPATEAAPSYTADVLILYTTATGNALGGASAVDNDASALIANANNFLTQSQVDDLQWRLVGVVEASGYTETGNLATDLQNLESQNTALGAFAARQRDAYGADEVMLIVNSSNDATAGISETPGALSVMIRAGAAGTFAHELAHNFNCHHDRLTDNASDNDGLYYYGYRYTDTSGRDVGTIMSYAAFRVPYYSNPNLTYQGHILGLPAGDPKAADNARVLRENAPIVAGFRAPVSGPPQITGEPASVTVAAGQSFTLSVMATGGNLTYQWVKDGMNIPAGTAATYMVGTSTAADAGSYTVTVSNSFGSVQSTPATVTVNAVNAAPAPSGSGSGGGAFGGWAALAVLALLTGRAIKWRPAQSRQSGDD